MTPAASNIGGGDSPQLAGRPKNATKAPRGARVLAAGQMRPEGASYGEHPNARRERLRRIAGLPSSTPDRKDER